MTCPKQSPIDTLVKYTKFSLSIIVLILSFSTIFAQDVLEEWKDFRSTSIQAPKKGTSSIVIFRPKDTISGPAVNIFIDGEYQASLLPDAYTQAPICAGVHHLSIAYTNILTQYKEKKTIGQKINPQVNLVSYYRLVSLSDKSMHLEELTSSQALEGIKKLSTRQNHTIPRISQRNCDKSGRNSKSLGYPVSATSSIKY